MSKRLKNFRIYQCLYTIFLISKIFGVCPLTIPCKRKYTTDKKSTVITIGLILIYGGYAVYQVNTVLKYLEMSNIFTLIEFLTAIVRLVTVLLVTMWEIIQQKKVLQLLEDISRFDTDINQKYPLEEEVTYKSDRLFSIMTVLVTTVLVVFLLVTSTVAVIIEGTFTYIELAQFAAIHAPEYVTCAITLQLSAFAALLGRRFARMNAELERLTKRWNNRRVYVSRTGSSEGTHTYFCLTKNELQGQLHSLRTSHYHLHTMSKSLNQIYTFPLLFVILRIFLDLVNNTLFLIYSASSIWRISSACLVVAIIVGQLLLIALTCSYATYQLKATGPILHEIKDTDDDIDDDVRFFSVQILQYKFKITAMYMLTMDRPLVTIVLAAVVSYVFLIIQLNMAQADTV